VLFYCFYGAILVSTQINPVRYEAVDLGKIIVPEGHRRPDDAKVAALAQSIADVGLLEPVGLTTDYHLIYGGHRLAAHAALNRGTIRATIHDLDGLGVELAQIDENIARHNLTGLEEAKAIARRKEIYELLHPETKAGIAQAAGSNRAQGKHVSDKLSPTFSEDMAVKTGKSKRTVERMAEIGKNLDKAAAKTLANTPVANNKTILKQVSELPPDAQREKAMNLVKERAAAGNLVTDVDVAIKAGLKAINTVTAALRACGLYEEYKQPLQSIKKDLKQHQAGPESPTVVSGPAPAARTWEKQ
jgi:ParB-like chromosome segregation protein Spo0J